MISLRMIGNWDYYLYNDFYITDKEFQDGMLAFLFLGLVIYLYYLIFVSNKKNENYNFEKVNVLDLEYESFHIENINTVEFPIKKFSLMTKIIGIGLVVFFILTPIVIGNDLFY